MYYNYAFYYIAKNEYDKAIFFLEESLKSNQESNMNSVELNFFVYRELFELYSTKNNNEKAKEYSHLYNKYKDIYDSLQKKGLSSVTNYAFQVEKDRIKKRNYIYYTIGVLVLILLCYRYYIYRKRNNENLSIIENKNEIIEEQDEYREQLESKLKVNLEEIMDYAKSNSPLFYTKFQEYKSDFHQDLLAICPSLNTNDLTILAYIYLDFPTKEIADYTFKSVRTIQSRKYNLRKKIGLDSNEDFYAWIKNI